jgi:hypothetical protein
MELLSVLISGGATLANQSVEMMHQFHVAKFGFMLLEFKPVYKHRIKCIGIEETILDMSKTCAFPT